MDLIFANDSLLCFCIRFELPNMQDILSRVVIKFFSQKTEQDHFFSVWPFFCFIVSFFSFFSVGFVLECRVLFADFAALGKNLVRSYSFPIFAWRNCLRQDQAQIEELTRFLNMPLD